MQLPDFLSQTIDLAEKKQKTFGQQPMKLHQVLVGPPGCGKTAIAEAYGHALHQRGLAAASPIILQAHMFNFIGEGAQAVADVPDGSVIVVDEADKLAASNPLGKEVINALLHAMEIRECTVILTGPAKGIEKLLESDPGLQRRLPSAIEITMQTHAKPAAPGIGWDTDTVLKKNVKPLQRIKLTPR